MADLAVHRSEDMSGEERRILRDLLDCAFEGSFTDEDWIHTVGGVHVLVQQDAMMVAHAAVVPRTLFAGQRRMSVGYVEGVATTPAYRHCGHASRAMVTVGTIIAQDYELGALSADVPAFYARLGWESWRGPTYVNAPAGRLRTADEDDGVMVLRTDRTGEIDLSTELTCDWRSGDVW